MTLGVFEGGSVTETHRHYAADGTYTGRTEVERHSPWDDEQREWALAHLDYKRLTCGHGHFLPTSTRTDLGVRVEHAKAPECHACTAIEKAKAKWHKDHRHTKQNCDCDKQIFWVEDHFPLPATPTTQTRR